MTKTTAAKATQTKTESQGQASVGGQQTGALAELAAKSPATTSLAVLQAKADGAPIQFWPPEWWKRRKAAKARKAALKGAGAGYVEFSDEDESLASLSGDSEGDFDEAGPAPHLAQEPRRRSGSAAEGKREASDDGGSGAGMVELLPESEEEEGMVELDPFEGLDLQDEALGGGLDVLENTDRVRGPLYANDDVGTRVGAEACKKRLKRFIKHARRVDPEEIGFESFASLRAKVQDTIDAMPDAEVDPEDLTDSSGLLAHAEGPGKSAAAGSDDIELTGEAVEEDASQAERRLAKIIAKVRGKLTKLSPKQQDIAIVALALIQQEITKLIDEQKSAGSAARVILMAGPAGYLEEKVLPVLISHIPGDLKEYVPWSPNRKRRNKAAQIGEGGVDIAWNAATLATDALSFGAASAGTAAIGGSYKAAFAAASVKRAGGSDAKATATGVVVFILETLQGLIPFYSGAAGIGGGFRGAAKAIYKTAKKAAKKRRGYASLGDQSNDDDGPEIFQLLEPRLAHGRALLEAAEEFMGEPGVNKLVDAAEEEMAYLERQMEKSNIRLGYGGGDASATSSTSKGKRPSRRKKPKGYERI